MFFRVLAVTGFLIAGFVAFAAWMMWQRPLAVDTMFSRVALSRAGLSDRNLELRSGPATVFTGGDGPTLVLLHGAGVQAGNWARTAPLLVEDYRLVIPDLAGHGGSAPAEGPISVGQVLAGLGDVLDTCCRDQPPVLVGNSLGAWVSFLYAAEHPERVARVVAVNGGPIAEPEPAVNLFPESRDEALETVKGLTGPATPPPPGFVLDDLVRWAKTGPAARLAATAAEMPRYLMDDRLDEVRVPVDLVWGEADELFDLDYAQRLLDGLPAVRLTTIPGCGHVPPRECPVRFVETLRSVLAQPPPAAKATAEKAPREEETP